MTTHHRRVGKDDGQCEGAQHHARGEEEGELRLRVGLSARGRPLGDEHRENGQCVEQQDEEGIEYLGRRNGAGQDQESQAHARQKCANDEAARRGKSLSGVHLRGWV